VVGKVNLLADEYRKLSGKVECDESYFGGKKKGPGGRGFKSHHPPKIFPGYSVVRLTRLLWEQEIGSSNLSTPTLRSTTCLCLRASFHDGALLFYTFAVLLYQGCHL
jgi:hypothetical protein